MANREDAQALHASILGAISSSHGFSDPTKSLWLLPFPSLSQVPDRFQLPDTRQFLYMRRTGYARLRDNVLGLCHRMYKLEGLPVAPITPPQHPYMNAALWGTMGSGKSYMLAALACDLHASFSAHSGGKQRVVYIPDCARLRRPTLRLEEFQLALLVSYADAGEDVHARISSLSDDASILCFFKDERAKDVWLYLIVDQMNALEVSKGDDSTEIQFKADARNAIEGLGSCVLTLEGLSANNHNAARWERKQLNIATMFRNGGLDDVEFTKWREHFGKNPETAIARLQEQELQRVVDATGRVPLFLNCWSRSCTTQEAWNHFITLREVRSADCDLLEFLTHQSTMPTWPIVKDAHLGFMTQGKVRVLSKYYDCRYLYVDPNDCGRCVCGLYRDLLGQTMQKLERLCFLKSEWKNAICREVQKGSPNPSLLGFMVEHEVLALIAETGIMLHPSKWLHVDEIVWFERGTESSLQLREGCCVMYLPSAFNYWRVDAVIRVHIVNEDKGGHSADSSNPQQRLEVYNKRSVHVIGVQVTLGSISKHEHSETQFFSPNTINCWYPSQVDENVGRWFVWVARQSDIREYAKEDAKDAVKLSVGLLVKDQVLGKTRTKTPVQLDHLTVFLPIEDFEPSLKMM